MKTKVFLPNGEVKLQEVKSVDNAPKKKSSTIFKRAKESFDKKTPLVGEVTAVKRLYEGQPNEVAVAVVTVNNDPTLRFYIPAEDFTEVIYPKDASGNLLEKKIITQERTLIKAARSTVEFVVTAFDKSSSVAVGNRVIALEMKQKDFFGRKDEDGEFLIQEGSVVRGRVTLAVRVGIRIEFGGKEVFVRNQELSHQRVPDAAKVYPVGSEVDCKIMKLVRLEDGTVDMELSPKAVIEFDPKPFFEQIQVSDFHNGEISGIDKKSNKVFVRLDSFPLDVYCVVPGQYGQLNIGEKVSVRILNKDEEKMRLGGVISNVERL